MEDNANYYVETLSIINENLTFKKEEHPQKMNVNYMLLCQILPQLILLKEEIPLELRQLYEVTKKIVIENKFDRFDPDVAFYINQIYLKIVEFFPKLIDYSEFIKQKCDFRIDMEFILNEYSIKTGLSREYLLTYFSNSMKDEFDRESKNKSR